MTDPKGAQPGKKLKVSQLGAAEELVQFRYASADETLRDLEASELIEALQGVIDLVSNFSKSGAFGEVPPPRVSVRPPEEGSFMITAVIEWWYSLSGAEQVPVVLGGVGTVGAMIRRSLKSLKSSPSDFEQLPNGKYKVLWPDGVAEEVTEDEFKALNKKTRQRKIALRKVMAPLGRDADVLEVRGDTDGDGTIDSQDEVIAVADRGDYRLTAVPPRMDEDTSEIVEVEAQLHAADFYDDTRWRMSMNGKVRTVTIEDNDFLAKINGGLALRKGDIMRVKVRVDVSYTNGRASTSRAIVEVLSHRRAPYEDDE